VRTRKWIQAGGLALALLAASVPGASAAPGDLDTAFSGDGKAEISLGAASGEERIEGLAVQPDGRIVGVGVRYATDSAPGRMLIVRLKGTGVLDPTFSGNGWRIVDLAGDATAYAVALQEDGKIVVVGEIGNDLTARAAIMRFRVGGALDTTFAGDGIRFVDLGTWTGPEAVQVLPNGKILVAGGVSGPGDDDMFVLRLTRGGGFDSTFSGDGRRRVDIADDHDWANAIGVQDDGKIVLVGNAQVSGDEAFGAARLLRSGQLDGTFGGGDGVVRVNAINLLDDHARGLSILPDGRILIGGLTTEGPSYDHALVRLTSGGTPDGSFGDGDGIVTPDPLSGSDYVDGVVAQLDGKLVFAGGHQPVGDPYEFEVARYTTNGSLDTTFGGGDGIVVTPFPNYALAYSVALNPSGKIVAAGRVDDGADDMAFARYRVL
jgi:uncharacterized delta-60 repeat protein